jgi:hypothetical protein
MRVNDFERKKRKTWREEKKDRGKQIYESVQERDVE